MEGGGPRIHEGSGTEPNRRNRTEPLRRTARNRPVNRTVLSTCSVFPCITGARGRVQVFGTFRPKPVLRPSTPNPAAQHPQPCLLLLLRRSNECRFPSTIQRQHMLSAFPCIAAGARGSTGFQHLQAQMFQNLYSPASPAQHPQPCLLLLRRSNESRFPSHQTKTARDLYSPALPPARGGVQVCSTFRPHVFQNLYSPASAAQHPQPCLLLLRRSNESRFLPKDST